MADARLLSLFYDGVPLKDLRELNPQADTVLINTVKLTGSSSGSVSLGVLASGSAYSLVFPSSQGGVNNTLSNDGSGNLSWVSIPSGTGANTQVAFWSGNTTLSSSSAFTFSGGKVTLSTLNQVNLVSASAIQVGNTTQTGATAGAGSLRYNSSNIQYSDGTNWNSLASSANFWALNGNTLTGDTSIGSINSNALVFQTNSNETGRFTPTGNFHLGSSTTYAEYVPLVTTTLLNGQGSPQTIFSYPTTQVGYFIKYTVVRGTAAQCGMLVICQTNNIASIADYGSTESPANVAFSVAVVAGNLELYYTSDNSGLNATMNYQICRF